MAYQTGSYTDQDNALDLMAAWAVSNGYTQNLLAADGQGKRLHIQKSIGGIDRFFNFRSTDGTEGKIAENPTDSPSIACQWSTGYNVANPWDAQDGHTVKEYGSTVIAAGIARDLIPTGGAYYFFATDESLSFIFETNSDYSDFRGFVVGASGFQTYYFASGGIRTGDTESSVLFGTALDGTGFSSASSNSAILVPSDGCYTIGEAWSGALKARVINPNISPRIDHDPDYSVLLGSLAWPIIASSPDSFKGNAVLAHSLVTITKATTAEYYPAVEVEGVKFVNMLNYTNGQEITYDSDTYKLFRVYNNGSNAGVAFLK